MSDTEDDGGEASREEERLSYEIYFYIVKNICDKGIVKISDLRKIYQKAAANDKTVHFRPLPEILNTVNENLAHFQGWRVMQQDDKLTYANVTVKPPIREKTPNETERVIGVLKNTLMFVFMTTKPTSKHPGVTHEDLMAYLETSLSTSPDHKLPHGEMEILKKQIGPNVRADFIKKGFLSVSKSVNENDEEVFRYEWGPVARQTVDPTQLVKIFQKLTGMGADQLKEQADRAEAWRLEQLDALSRGVVIPTRGK